MSHDTEEFYTFAFEIIKISGSFITAVGLLWWWMLKIILRDATNALVLDLEKRFVSRTEFDDLKRRMEAA